MTHVYIARVPGDEEIQDEDLPEGMIVNLTHNEQGLSGHYALVSIFDGDHDYVEIADLKLMVGEKREIEFQARRYAVRHLPESEPVIVIE